MDDDNPLKGELIELQFKEMMKQSFQTMSPVTFWCAANVRRAFQVCLHGYFQLDTIRHDLSL